MEKRNTLRIRNWDHWQSYRRDRGQPPWIKVHRCLMRDLDWVMMTDAQRGQLVAIWLLAADHDGVIPASPDAVRKLCHMSSPPDLKLFIEQGFIDGDAKATPKRRQSDAPETETETETEKREKKQKPRVRMEKPDFVSDEVWRDYHSHRTNLKAKLTPTAWSRIQTEIKEGVERGHTADDMLSEAMAAGWRGFKLEWYENRVNGSKPKSAAKAAVEYRKQLEAQRNGQ